MSAFHTLRLESAPLHTETPKWASHAPHQVEAVFKRGAHVVGFTEVTKAVAPGIEKQAKEYGYKFIHGHGDPALAIKDKFNVLDKHGFVLVSGQRGYSDVTFDFYGHVVTVFMQHWGTNHPEHHATRVAQNKALIEGMRNASKKQNLAFFMSDCNPDGPLSHKDSFPRKELNDGGIELIYEELNKWPNGIGVNAIGHSKHDRRAKGHKVEVHDALGSDHHPVTAYYRIPNPA